MSWFKLVSPIILVVIWALLQWPDGNLRLVFCDVGQGDAQLIIKGSYQVLVDTGPSDDKIGVCLSDNLPFWDRRIELVVITHPQKDHMGGLDEILGRYKVDRLVVNGVKSDDVEEWQEVVYLVEASGVEVYIPEAGDRFVFEGVEMEVLWPEDEWGDEMVWRGGTEDKMVLGAISDVNEISIVMRLEFDRFTAMLTGDIGEKEELAQVGKGVIGQVEVLKVAHHGSKYSSSEVFVNMVKPKLAVIQVGEKNTHGHPSSMITERFDTVGSRVVRTDRDGETVVVSDGQSWWLEQDGQSFSFW